MSFQITEYPNFSWSFSRDELFRECKRKYYFHYYASHNGWLGSAPQLNRLAYRLKHLTSIPLLFGSAIHQAAQRLVLNIINNKTKLTENDLIDIVRDNMNYVVWESRNPQYWLRSPSKHNMLAEYYYGKGLSTEIVNIIRQETSLVISNLIKSQTLNDITGPLNKVFEVDEQLTSITLYETTIYVRIDTMYSLQNGYYYICDWKTGKKVKTENKQLPLYAMYARERYHVPLEQLCLRLEFLTDGTNLESCIDNSYIDFIIKYIGDSICDMKRYLINETENTPLQLEKFHQTENKRTCLNCNFRELCNIQKNVLV